MRKFMDWLGALLCVSILLRCMFYLGLKAYLGAGLQSFDWLAVPIGLVSAYIGYMYFKRIFGRGRVAG